MLGQCSVTGLTRNHHMFALLFLFHYIGVAGLAGVVAGKGNWPRRGFCDCCPAIVSVFSEAARYDRRPQNQKYGQQDNDDHREPDEMFYVLEQIRHLAPKPECDPEHKQALYFDTLGLSPER